MEDVLGGVDGLLVHGDHQHGAHIAVEDSEYHLVCIYTLKKITFVIHLVTLPTHLLLL